MHPDLVLIIQSGGYVIAGLVLLLLAKVSKDLLTPFNDDQQLTTADNPALGISLAGYYAAVLAIYIASSLGFEDYAFTWSAYGRSLLWDGSFALMGIPMLLIARGVVDRVCLPGVPLQTEIIRDRNVGAGAVEAGTFLGSGLLVAGANYGPAGTHLHSLVFFAIGLVALCLLGLLYRALTPFSVRGEIESDNHAAGVSFGGWLSASGLVICSASVGGSLAWTDMLIDFAYTLGFGLVLLIIGRFVADRIILPKARLSKEISQDRNLAAAVLEAGIAVGFAGLIFASY